MFHSLRISLFDNCRFNEQNKTQIMFFAQLNTSRGLLSDFFFALGLVARMWYLFFIKLALTSRVQCTLIFFVTIRSFATFIFSVLCALSLSLHWPLFWICLMWLSCIRIYRLAIYSVIMYTLWCTFYTDMIKHGKHIGPL